MAPPRWFSTKRILPGERSCYVPLTVSRYIHKVGGAATEPFYGCHVRRSRTGASLGTGR